MRILLERKLVENEEELLCSIGVFFIKLKKKSFLNIVLFCWFYFIVE